MASPPPYDLPLDYSPLPPSYSVVPSSDEYPILGLPVQLLPDSSSSSSSLHTLPSHYLSLSSHLSLNLGPRLFKFHSPVYGYNALVQGNVSLSSLQHVTTLVLKLRGCIVNTVYDRGLVVCQSQVPLLRLDKVLFTTGHGRSIPSDPSGRLTCPFSIPLPSYILGGSLPLPPSFSAVHPRYSCNVKYSIRVVMHRKGFRPRESVEHDFLYLPASFSVPPSLSTSITSIDIHTLPDCDIILRLPGPKRYPASSSIPISLRFLFSGSSLRPYLLACNLSLELVRYITLYVEGRRSIRETILAHGNLSPPQEPELNTYIVEGTVRGGQAGGEHAWSIPEMAETKYFLRLSITKQKQETIPLLPNFVHEEAITLTTHSLPTESAGVEDELASVPAVGMLRSGFFQHNFYGGPNHGNN